MQEIPAIFIDGKRASLSDRKILSEIFLIGSHGDSVIEAQKES